MQARKPSKICSRKITNLLLKLADCGERENSLDINQRVRGILANLCRHRRIVLRKFSYFLIFMATQQHAVTKVCDLFEKRFQKIQQNLLTSQTKDQCSFIICESSKFLIEKKVIPLIDESCCQKLLETTLQSRMRQSLTNNMLCSDL